MSARETKTQDRPPNALWELVYEELHGLAEQYFRNQPAAQTLQPTALVHEAYLKLRAAKHPRWTDATHFYRTAALAMRQILVDHARSRRRRGAVASQLAPGLGVPRTDPAERALDLVALDDALRSFAEQHPRESRVVELRYFGGLSVEQTAEVEGVSPATVKRDWTFAKAWLLEELAGQKKSGNREPGVDARS